MLEALSHDSTSRLFEGVDLLDHALTVLVGDDPVVLNVLCFAVIVSCELLGLHADAVHGPVGAREAPRRCDLGLGVLGLADA